MQNNKSNTSNVNLFYLSAAFLLISGIASLTYQVTWVRLLGLSMGSTSAAISTVLAAFFSGLALGSYLAERITRNRINNLRPYIILEIIIGVSGLILLPVLLNLDSLMALMPQLGSTLPMKFAISMALLILPTLCMGATFPVMASIMIRQQENMGQRMSQLYSLNTAGAVLGACLSGFVFIPNWGLDGSIYIAFVLNLFIVISGLYINRNLDLPPLEFDGASDADGQHANQQDHVKDDAPFRTVALIVLFFTGFVAIATEVGWTKYLVIFAGTTIYGFASILTIFLIGIAAGSWVIKSKMENMQSPQTWMAVGLVLLGGSLLLTRAGLSAVPNLYQAVNHLPAPDFIVHMVKYGFIFVLLIIPTFLFGALFPINLKLYCGNLSGIRSRIGKAYAVNTLAAIFGSILAGFWIIPELGTDWLLSNMALLILVLPFLFIRAVPGYFPRLAIIALTFFAVLGNWTLPHLDYEKLIASVGYDEESRAGKTPEFLFLKEGKAGVVSMITFDGRHAKLQNNGLNESFIDMEDPNNALVIESMLGLMPYFLHNDPKKAFIVGFGGGITTRALTHTDLESIHVVELEPAVVDAGRAIIDGDEIEALLDERVRLDFNDARNTLLVENETYDLIVAQPSHPWRAGAANVFTKEFFEIVKLRLNNDGIYGQWINLFHMDATTLRALMRSYVEVFPEVVSFANLESGDFLMFGSREKLKFDFDKVTPRFNRDNIKKLFAQYDIYKPSDLFWYFGLSRDEIMGAIGDSPMNTDTNIMSEVRLSRLVKEPTGDEDPYKFLRSHFKYDVMSYMKENQAAENLYQVAMYFMRWDSADISRKIATQLEKKYPLWGRGLAYEILWKEGNRSQAIEYFQKHDDWFDATKKLQIVALAEVGQLDEASKLVKTIQDEKQQSLAKAYMLYKTQNWRVLAGVVPKTDYERVWQLIGLSKFNLKAAGIKLEELINADSENISALRVLVQYAARYADETALDKYSKHLAGAIENVDKNLSKMGEQAITQENLRWAESILHKMESSNSDQNELANLKEKINSLKEQKDKKAS